MKLSAKRKTALFNAVHEKVFRARIAVAKLTNDVPLLGREIDEILRHLNIDAPEAAVRIFEKEKA